VDWLPERGTVVVATECQRCGESFVGEVCEDDLKERCMEGPWKTEPCAFCRNPVLKSQTAEPRLWPNLPVCLECRKIWEVL
jgi:hypothetical protein